MSEDFDSDDRSDLLSQIVKALDDSSSSGNDEAENLEQSHLAEDFNFFVSSQGSHSPKKKDATAKDCRILYRKLREQAAILEERRVLMEMEETRLANRRAQFEEEVKRWTESERADVEAEASEWKRKYLALKEKYKTEKKEWKEKRAQMIRAQSSTASFMRLTLDSPKPAPVSPLKLDELEIPKTPEAKKRKKSGHKKRGSKLSPRLQPPSPPPKRKLSTEPEAIPKIVRPKPLSQDYKLDFKYNPGPPVAVDDKSNGRQIVRYRNGATGTIYDNGTKKVKNGDVTYIFYSNKDISIEFPDGAQAYQYNNTKTIELQLPDGTKLVQFSNGQREKHLTNGDTEITFPNGTVKLLHPNGEFEINPSGR